MTDTVQIKSTYGTDPSLLAAVGAARSYAVSAKTAQVAASGAANAASAAATQAAATLGDVTESVEDAAASAIAAQGAATTSQAGAATAQGAATNAAGSASLARKWAIQTNEEVAQNQGFGAKKYALDAGGSATAAAQSESNAAASATGAASNAASAVAAYNNFRNRNYGPLSSPPATRPDGTDRIFGDEYYDISNPAKPVLKIYNGTAWSTAVFDAGEALLASNNLSDLNNKKTARTNLFPAFANKPLYLVRVNAAGDDFEPTLGSSIPITARTSNTKLGSADIGNRINLSGTFTQAFDTPATLAAGWWVRLANAGSGSITIPASDGVANWVMYPGEVRDFYCDGTALYSDVVKPFFVAFTASGSFVKPPGYSAFAMRGWGAGGSGARSVGNTAATGGGGGACVEYDVRAAAFAATESFAIGSGGAPQAGNANGTVGGNTTLGAFFIAYGGGPGRNNAFGANGGGWLSSGAAIPGAPSQLINASSQAYYATNGFGGGSGVPTSPSSDPIYGGGASSLGIGVGQNSVFGGAGGGSVAADGTLTSPGLSKIGGNGGVASQTGAGTAGAAPGGGGGATQTGAQSGAGGRGELHIWGVV